jgi:hypothetical protein
MEGQNRVDGRRVRAVVGEALRTPRPWAAGALAGLFGMALDQVLLGAAAALVVPAAWIATALRDPDFSRKALRARSENEAQRLLGRLRDDTANVDAATRERLDTILRAYVAVYRECAAHDVPPYARAPLAATVAQMKRLASQATDLATRRTELSAFLEGVNRSELHGRQASLRARCAQADDPILKAQLEQSLRFKGEEINAYDAIALAIRRIDGQLESVECAFTALKARLLRFKSDEKTEWTTAGEQLRGGINSLSVQIDTLDDSVREVLTLRGS